MKKIILSLSLIILLMGCSSMYKPGIYGSHVPTHIFTTKKSNSNRFNQMDLSSAQIFHEQDSNFILRNRLVNCKRGKFGSINTGMMIYGGMYQVVNIDEKSTNYEYYGFGPEFSATLFLPLGSVKWGFGLYGSIVLEQGAYYNFLIDNSSESDVTFFNPQFTTFSFLGLDLTRDETMVFQIAAREEFGFMSLAFMQNETSFTVSWSPAPDYHRLYSLGSFSVGLAQKF